MALLVSSSVYVFIFLTVLNFTLLRTSGTKCTLDIQLSATNNSDCGSGSWGGFINNSNCCTSSFDDYLYALGRRANLSGDIFLNATDQKSCLMSMKEEFKSNVLGCGIEKLTAGAGGCSDYTVVDTFNKLGDRLKTLDEDCKGLSSSGRSDQACIECLRSWEKIGGSSDDEVQFKKAEADVCRYAVLVTLTGSRIDDAKWVQAVFDCLRQQPLVTADEKEGATSSSIKTSTGLVILVGSIVGISAIVLIAALIIFRKGTENSLSTGKDEFHESLSKITIKEVYLATNNLSTPNFIGQGVAGKVYKGKLSNGQHVAVKHITDDGYVETFVREVRSLSHVQHPNLVALLGHCEDNDDCFLVYELCHNGNLSEWLYNRVLSWIQRLEIAIDCARGLWFLHTYPEGRIVHRDIKAKFLMRGGNIAEFADPKLNGEYSFEAFDFVLKLALSCTELKQQRPSMEQVVLNLEKALDISNTTKLCQN
ncbi:hypothetical protein EZV62_017638 [Acer yangbiense]|uniref:Protein kinase domain-containing protein n=1 Tax=Acer yangbiense TaxID=1000413 RepID=A0A5C7HHU8_9ROSI|nr:hypothetical protein EZV62_017638 [Acer yangbiense]